MQKTTGLGLGGLSGSVTSLFNLFGDYQINEFSKALSEISIKGLGLAIGSLIVSIVAIYYNENKPATVKPSK